MNEHLINGARFDGMGGVKFPKFVVLEQDGNVVKYIYEDKYNTEDYANFKVIKIDIPDINFNNYKFYSKESLSLYIENCILKETLDAVIINTLS